MPAEVKRRRGRPSQGLESRIYVRMSDEEHEHMLDVCEQRSCSPGALLRWLVSISLLLESPGEPTPLPMAGAQGPQQAFGLDRKTKAKLNLLGVAMRVSNATVVRRLIADHAK